MPRMAATAAMTANQQTVNLLADQLGEWVQRPSRVSLAVTGSTTGIRATFIVGGVSVLDDVLVGNQNRFPIFPDDIIGQWMVGGGAQLFLSFREAAGGTPTYYYIVDTDPG
jgi:hypothetical protein